jgi:hypothetical protein
MPPLPVRIAVLVASTILGPALAIAQGGPAQPPVVTVLTINAGADTVSSAAPALVLNHTIVGSRPSDYRVSRRADFAGAAWLAYMDRITVRDWYDPTGPSCDPARATHRVTLYFQVRSTLGTEFRIVDGQRHAVPARVESNVLKASICARTP